MQEIKSKVDELRELATEVLETTTDGDTRAKVNYAKHQLEVFGQSVEAGIPIDSDKTAATLATVSELYRAAGIVHEEVMEGLVKAIANSLNTTTDGN